MPFYPSALFRSLKIYLKEMKGQEVKISEYLECYRESLYPQHWISSFVSRVISYVLPAKYRVGDVVSVAACITTISPMLIEYFAGEFIIAETPKALRSYKLYKLYPLNSSESWEPLLISQDFIDRA